MRLNEIKPEFVELLNKEPEPGILYISEKYKTAIHLCACGCGGKTVTPLGAGDWTLTKSDQGVTLRPSIGNWAGEPQYHAHYYITDNKIEWLP